MDRTARLKRFLPPQLAELIVNSGDEKILESHRRDIAVLFCDLRGFTAFAETAEPEEVMGLLREYHEAMGPLIHAHGGTLDSFAGDGIMVFFNDPLPCPNGPERAVRLAVDMRQAFGPLATLWRKRGHEVGFGVGIASGYATLGRVGYEGRFDYTAIGTVTNLAARLCGQAKNGQILITTKVAAAVDEVAELESVGEVELKGLSRPLPLHNVCSLKAEAPAGA